MFEEYYNEELTQKLKEHPGIICDSGLKFDPPDFYEEIVSHTINPTFLKDIISGSKKHIFIFEKNGTITVKLIEHILFKLKIKFHLNNEKALDIINNNIQLYLYAFNKFCGLHISNVLNFKKYKFISKHIYIYKNIIELLSEMKNIYMKFDIVIGNPPYQPPNIKNGGERKGSGNKIWHKFVEISFAITRDDGIVSLITPSHWRVGIVSKKNQIKKAQEIMWNYDILYISSASEKFNGTAEHMTIDAWVIDKSKQNKQKSSLRKNCFLPIKENSNKNKIEEFFEAIENEKCFTIDIKDNRSYNFDCIRKSTGGDVDHIYKHANTISQVKKNQFDWYTVKTKGFDLKKVIITTSVNINVEGNYLSFYDNGETGCGHNCLAYSVDSKIDGKKLEHFINNSSVVRSIIKEYNGKAGYAVPLLQLKYIPKSFVDRFWKGEKL